MIRYLRHVRGFEWYDADAQDRLEMASLYVALGWGEGE
jgi:hypothetical protein